LTERASTSSTVFNPAVSQQTFNLSLGFEKDILEVAFWDNLPYRLNKLEIK
jgi:hypothetical protein